VNRTQQHHWFRCPNRPKGSIPHYRCPNCPKRSSPKRATLAMRVLASGKHNHGITCCQATLSHVLPVYEAHKSKTMGLVTTSARVFGTAEF
jgi:hypothetical protein